MVIQILGNLCYSPAPRDTQAPWLGVNTIKSVLDAPFTVQINTDVIVIPEGYVTDWSTTPRAVWYFFPPNYFPAQQAAIVHDYIYSHLHWDYSRFEADRIFYSILAKNRTPLPVRQMFYRAVRTFGRGGWYWRNRTDADPHWKIRHAKIPYSSSS